MSRTRIIKPAFFKNELLGQMPSDAALTFIGLWGLADREGRLENRPLRIKAELFPYKEVNIEEAFSLLESKAFIHRYQVNGKDYIQIANFLKHQRPHHAEQESIIPDSDGNLPTKVGIPTNPETIKMSINPSLTLNPSHNALTLNPSPVVSEKYDDDFERFWQAYPKKDNRLKAHQTWVESAGKRPPTGKLLEAVTRYTESVRNKEPRFIKEAANWLKAEKWSDEGVRLPKIDSGSASKSKPLPPNVDPYHFREWMIKEGYPEQFHNTPFTEVDAPTQKNYFNQAT